MNARLLKISLLAALLCAALPVRAGLFDDDEARRQISDLRAQINNNILPQLEKIETTQRGQLELSSQIEALRAEVARLRGQIEVLTFELESAQKRQKDFYVDLDSRLRKLESPPAPKAEQSAPTPATAPADPAAETRDYEAALNLFKSAKYKEAVAAFQGFIKAYPSGGFLPSAHYWAGNSHYQLREYAKASDLYNTVVTSWGSDAKAPDAMLGIANCQQETGDAKGSRKTLESLVAKYPTSPAAEIARQRLKKKT
jgi:tol-pal system protein YbgF